MSKYKVEEPNLKQIKILLYIVLICQEKTFIIKLQKIKKNALTPKKVLPYKHSRLEDILLLLL